MFRPRTTRGVVWSLGHRVVGTTTTTSTARWFRSSSWRGGPIKTRFLLPDPSSPNEMSPLSGRWSPKLTKIVATIGPTSEQLPVLQQVVANGMRIMRLNFSHATVDEVELRTSNLAQCRGRHSLLDDDDENVTSRKPNVRAVLLDTKGPEIRTGKLANDDTGHQVICLQQGETIVLDTSKERQEAGSTTEYLYIDYNQLHESVQPGNKVLLDDGAVVLTVTQVDNDDKTVTCRIDNTGELRSRAGVNLPGAATSLPAMSDKDRTDIKYGMTKDIDYIAASFVQDGPGVEEIRRYVQQCADELAWPHDKPLPLLISKIESLSALENFDDILEKSDGIMVARGDLGVELPLQQVTNAQKEMVAACNAVGKPVIVATQMLESMAKNPRPTRAEVSDVTNAIYDGADCVMLSGETAKGQYPVEAVRVMNEIIQGAEGYAKSGGVGGVVHRRFEGPATAEGAVAKAAVVAALQNNNVSAVVVLCPDDGDTTLAGLVAAHRPPVPILVFCPNPRVARQLMIYRGVHPVVGLKGVPWAKRADYAVHDATAMGFLNHDDDIVVVTVEDSQDVGPTPTMKLVKVP